MSQNVAFALQVIGKPRSHINKVVPETLELVGLDGKGQRMPDELSGGEQQRVAIARAFVNRPKILIADEPTGNLDPNTSVGIMKLLDRINRTGTTVVMATHDAGIVDQMRKRVIELDDGRVVRDQARGVYGYQPRLGALTFPMQLRYVFSETATGLRRNVSMSVALIVTIFVSLTLVGMGLLLNAQADKAEKFWGSKLQITVFMCNQNSKAATLPRRGHRRSRGPRSRTRSTTTPRWRRTTTRARKRPSTPGSGSTSTRTSPSRRSTPR